MRTVASEIGFRERRGQGGMGSRAAALRKARRRTLALELLESRVLMATLPMITHDPNAPVPIDLAQTGSAPGGGATDAGDNATTSNESSPTIVIDPNNAQKLVSVWTTHTAATTSTIEGAYSTNAGLSWTSFAVAPVKTTDPQTSAAFTEITNATVAFDHSENFYVVSQENNANDQSGAVFLERYSFTGAAPGPICLPAAGASKMIFGPWNTTNVTSPTGSEVLSLSLAVDSGVSSFTDSGTSWSVKDNTTGQRLRSLGSGHAGQRDDEHVLGPVRVLEQPGGDVLRSVDSGSRHGNRFLAAVDRRPGGHRLGNHRAGAGDDHLGQLCREQRHDRDEDLHPDGRVNTTHRDAFCREHGRLRSHGPGTVAVASTNAPVYPVQYPLTTPASPNLGIGPEAVITTDNTLGAFSQFQGRIYVAYVNRLGSLTTNTDIFLISSSNGGTTWSAPRAGQSGQRPDGWILRGSTTNTSGRTQFLPAVAVDLATGTLVVDYYDTRDDAANARYATYVTTSIDGGNTFATDTFANAPNTAFNTITQQNVVLGPIPDDQSAGNPNTDTTSPSATIRVWRCSRATSTRPGRATRAAASTTRTGSIS